MKVKDRSSIGSFRFVRNDMPETRRRTLDELEDDFCKHDTSRYVQEAQVGVRGS